MYVNRYLYFFAFLDKKALAIKLSSEGFNILVMPEERLVKNHCDELFAKPKSSVVPLKNMGKFFSQQNYKKL